MSSTQALRQADQPTEAARDEGASFGVRMGFGLSSLAVGSAGQIVAVLGLRFMTDSLAISAGVAGAIFALIRVWDGVVDPMVGYLSDRTSTRWGRRLPYVAAGSVLLPLAVVGLFAAPPIQSPLLLTCFVTLMLMLHGTGYSLIMVPLSSMGVEVTDDYHERSAIQTYKSNGTFFGGVLGSSLPPWLLVIWGASRLGNASMAVTVGALLLAIGLWSTLLLRKTRATTARSQPSGNLIDQARLAWRNKPFRVLVIVHVIFMSGVATAASSNAYFTRYVLGRTDAWLAVFYIYLTAGNVLSVPFWLACSRRWDKKRTYCVSLLFYGLFVGSWMLAGRHDPYWTLALRVFLTGLAMGGVVLMAGSMLTDAVRYDYITSGHRREGAFSGFISLIDKFSSAIGLAGMGFLLAQMGYVSSSGGAHAQSGGATLAISLSFSLFPAITSFACILLMGFYTLKEGDLLEQKAAGGA